MPSTRSKTPQVLGVVIVTYNSADVIADCLDSLFAQNGAKLRIVICDNASSDDTVCAITRTAAGDLLDQRGADDLSAPERPVTLIRSRKNLGFAGGVNLGLATLQQVPEIGLFWILNPDCTAAPNTAAAFLRSVGNGIGLIGGRTLFRDGARTIQTDGGRVNWLNGVCHSVHQGFPVEATPPPSADSLDFVSGANMAATREFLAEVGPMPEDYFLYYEEVDWAQRRGLLKLAVCAEAIVHHVGGSAIGSGMPTRAPSAMSNYFNYRNRLRFMWRYRWRVLPLCWGFGMMKVAQHICRSEWQAATGALRGLCGLKPPVAVRFRLGRRGSEQQVKLGQS